METYTRSVATDFSGTFNKGQFHQEIDNSNISIELVTINLKNDAVSITFNSALSGEELTILNTLISNHTVDTSIPKTQFYTSYLNTYKIKDGTYTLIARVDYKGSKKIGIINYIEILAKMDDNIDSYSVKIIESVKSHTIVEKTDIKNTEFENIDLGEIEYMPEDPIILEVYVKRDGGKKKSEISIEQVIIYYGN